MHQKPMNLPQPRMNASNSYFKVLNIAQNTDKVNNAIEFGLSQLPQKLFHLLQ